MDPVTAFGLACNVLQVVEIGIKITGQIKEIHDRGSLLSSDEVELWAVEVLKNNQDLNNEVKAKGSKPSPADIRIQRLAEDTIKIADELKRLLNTIVFAKRQAGVKASALKQLVRTHFKKTQIEKLRTQLKGVESALDRTILREL